MDIKEVITQQAKRAKKASYAMMKVSTETKNTALLYIAQELDKKRAVIIEENKKDIKAAVEKNISKAFIDRLTLDNKYIDTMIKSLHDVIMLKDPVGEITHETIRPNGMKVIKMRMPLGVIGIIFESRPNVCVDAASLTIKSGNSVILRGGSDAYYSNMCLSSIIKEALKKAGICEGAVEIIDSKDRESVGIMVKLKESIDVIIPRGGKGLVDFVAANSTIPVIYHDAGICHTYVDKDADIDMAIKVAINAKVQRPSTCNAMETLLVHADIAKDFFPRMSAELKKNKVEIKSDNISKKYFENAKDATEEDYKTEYNDMILNVKTVKSLDEAIEHINTYSSHHSDAIITNDKNAADSFVREVDSSACFVNASTRLNDGFEFGLGSEMGISNQKLHARGPVGLIELTSEKYIVRGSGQIRG